MAIIDPNMDMHSFMGQNNTDVMMQDMQSYSSSQPQEIAEAIVSLQAPYRIQHVNLAWLNVMGFRSVTGIIPHMIYAIIRTYLDIN